MDYTRQEILESLQEEIERKEVDAQNSIGFTMSFVITEGLTVIEVPHQKGPNAQKVRRNLGFGGK